MKIGVVDVGQVFQSSQLTGRKQQELKRLGDARREMLEFVHSYRVLTPEQAARFRELSTKPTLSPAEKIELDKIKADVIAADKAFKALQTKPNPTPEEVAKLQDFNSRASAMSQLEQRWIREFDAEVRDTQGKMRNEVIQDIHASVREIGRKQGYTLIFVRDVAPYAANDVTQEALNAVNAKK